MHQMIRVRSEFESHPGHSSAQVKVPVEELRARPIDEVPRWIVVGCDHDEALAPILETPQVSDSDRQGARASSESARLSTSRVLAGPPDGHRPFGQLQEVRLLAPPT